MAEASDVNIPTVVTVYSATFVAPARSNVTHTSYLTLRQVGGSLKLYFHSSHGVPLACEIPPDQLIRSRQLAHATLTHTHTHHTD
jgi:hypothetical protein